MNNVLQDAKVVIRLCAIISSRVMSAAGSWYSLRLNGPLSIMELTCTLCAERPECVKRMKTCSILQKRKSEKKREIHTEGSWLFTCVGAYLREREREI